MRVFFGAWCESKAVKISSIDMSDNMKTEGNLDSSELYICVIRCIRK